MPRLLGVGGPVFLFFTLFLGVETVEGQGGPEMNLGISNSMVGFPPPSAQHFVNGHVEFPGGVTLSVQTPGGGNPWRLWMLVSSGVFTPNGKARSDLQWRAQGSPWQGTEGVQLVASGQGSSSVMVHFRALLDWAQDDPGSGSIALTFVLLRPNQDIADFLASSFGGISVWPWPGS